MTFLVLNETSECKTSNTAMLHCDELLMQLNKGFKQRTIVVSNKMSECIPKYRNVVF